MSADQQVGWRAMQLTRRELLLAFSKDKPQNSCSAERQKPPRFVLEFRRDVCCSCVTADRGSNIATWAQPATSCREPSPPQPRYDHPGLGTAQTLRVTFRGRHRKLGEIQASVAFRGQRRTWWSSSLALGEAEMSLFVAGTVLGETQGHLSWQALYLVTLTCHLSGQAQNLVTFRRHGSFVRSTWWSSSVALRSACICYSPYLFAYGPFRVEVLFGTSARNLHPSMWSRRRELLDLTKMFTSRKCCFGINLSLLDLPYLTWLVWLEPFELTWCALLTWVFVLACIFTFEEGSVMGKHHLERYHLGSSATPVVRTGW